MEGDVLLVVVVVVALGFDFTNGFHDTANAVATSISTRALPPRLAVAIASVANLVGAFVTTAVATTVGSGVLDTQLVTTKTVLAALFGAIAWNLATWWLGLPSSSSHALIGGLVGAALAQSGVDGVQWHNLAHKVIIPAFIAPTIAFAAAFVLLIAIFWIFQRMPSAPANRTFRIGQLFSGTFVAFTHGANDAQKTMGVIALALLANGSIDHVLHSRPGSRSRRRRDRRRHLCRRLADHADDRTAAVQDRAARRVRGPGDGRRRDRCRDPSRLPALDHPRDLRGRARLRLHAPLPRRALGHRRQHRRRLVPDHPSGRASWPRLCTGRFRRSSKPNLPPPFTVPVPTLAASGTDSEAVESQRAESGFVLLLTAEERAALVRVLRVVGDNWWLDETEREVLERLENPAAELVPAA